MATEERKVEYTFDDLEPMKEKYDLNLSDLEEICAYKPKDNSPYRLITCKPKNRDEEACPICRAECCTTIHGKTEKPRYVHDISAGIIQIDLSVEVPRYMCKNCGGTFSHRFKSIPENRQFTYRLLEQIQRDSFTRPFDDVASNFGISAQIVGGDL